MGFWIEVVAIQIKHLKNYKMLMNSFDMNCSYGTTRIGPMSRARLSAKEVEVAKELG